MNDLIIYKTYPDLASAEEVALLMTNNGITAEVIKENRVLDSNYIGQAFSDPYLLYMHGSDFERAHTILENEIMVNLEDVDPGYMLLAFNEEELIDVMEKKDEWGVYNYKLAEALLKKKNAHIPEVKIALEQAERLRTKEKPVASGMLFLLLGYASVLSGMVSIFIPARNAVLTLSQGLLGLFIGWILCYSKRTLSNGQRTFYFTSSSRLQGSVMFWISLAVTAIKIIFLLTSITA